MIEAECKILDIDKKDMIKRMNDFYMRSNIVPPVLYFDGTIKIFYYQNDAKDRIRLRLFENDKCGIFYNGGKMEVSTKSDVSDATQEMFPPNIKVKNEFSFMVEKHEFVYTQDFLNSLGYTKYLELEKQRTSYKLFSTSYISYEFDNFIDASDRLIGEPWLEIEFKEKEGLDMALKSISKTIDDVSDITTPKLFKKYANY